MQTALIIKKKRSLPEGLIEKGQTALKAWRESKEKAKKKGPEAYAQWVKDEEIKKAQKKVSPIGAIKNFCNSCVGDKISDITNCTATKCPLYIYRPYQKGDK
jgi:hypothetical protein